MQHLANRKIIAHNLEALRGFVALVVVLGHIVYNEFYLDAKYYPGFFKYLKLPGHLGVLIFFVISGYVIGLSNKKMETSSEVWSYLKKRFLRLYPIYFVSIIFAVLITEESLDFSVVLGNLTFTQIFVAPVISANSPSWSLQYEVIYYLLFIPVLFFRINPFLLVIVSLFIGIVNVIFSFLNVPALTSYAIGYVFWIGGFTLSKFYFPFEKQINYTKLVSFFFLILSLLHFNVFSTLLSKVLVHLFGSQLNFSGVYWAEVIIRVIDLAILPYCLFFILIFSDRRFKYDRLVVLFLQLFPALTLVFIFNNLQNDIIIYFLFPSIFYFISCLLFFIKADWVNDISNKVIRFFIWIGSFSYGIYIIHFPLLILFKRIDVFNGSLLSFIIRFFLYMGITIIMAYLLEKKLQIAIKNMLTK